VSVGSQIEQFIVNNLHSGRDVDSLTDDYDLLAGEVIDSLGIAELITFLEKEYGIQVDDGDLDPENFRTVGKIVAFVESKES
jgi:acyl carrier protein